MKEHRRRCAQCGEKLTTSNPRAIYCSKSCRQLAWLHQKKTKEELSGFHSDEQQEAPKQNQPQEPVETNQYPVLKKDESTNTSPPASNRPRQNKATDFPQEDDLDFGDTADFDIHPKNWPLSKETQSWRSNSFYTKNKNLDDLSLDQRMAYEQMNNEFSSDDFIDEKQHSDAPVNPQLSPVPASKGNTGWQPLPFAEPSPVEVKPIYRRESVSKLTTTSEKLLEQAQRDEENIVRWTYEKYLLEGIYKRIADDPVKVCLLWKAAEPGDEYALLVKIGFRPFSDLLTSGSGLEIGMHLHLGIERTTTQEHNQQVQNIHAKAQSYERMISAAQKQIAEIKRQLNNWGAKVQVMENVLVNKDQYEAYQTALREWKQRKTLHEDQQIKEREEFLKQQQKIQSLQGITEKKQPPITPAEKQSLQNEKKNQPPVFKKIETLSQSNSTPPVTPVKSPLPVPTGPPKKKRPKGIIINSMDAHKYSEGVYPFEGRYGRFIGHPPVNFEMVVHGTPGQGKSFFSYRFAYYLAENWGRVLYIASEEGLGQTTLQKLLPHPNLDLVDINNLESIFKGVKKDTYKFIFFDSLKHLGINYERYIELRDHFENEAFISIQQSTKNKEMAGEQSIKHEIDIEIMVEDCYAITGKTRSLHSKTGLVFDIFPEDRRIYHDESIAVI